MLQLGALCVPFGLQSLRGRRLNGRTGEVRGFDACTGRAIVQFDPKHLPSAWKKINPALLHVVSPVLQTTRSSNPVTSCPCMLLQASEWKVRIAACLRMHDKVLLSCTSRFFHTALSTCILGELNGCQDKTSASQSHRSDSDSEDSVKVSDHALLYLIAKLILLPEFDTKVIHFDARIPLTSDKEMPGSSSRSCRDNANIMREYETYFQQTLRSNGINTKSNLAGEKLWRPEMINYDHFQGFRQALDTVVESGHPFTVTFSRSRNMECLFKEQSASQGGPIFVTAMHVAARIGDTALCQMLCRMGALLNSNILIPNDQMSHGGQPNLADGSDFSQYRWGLVTPMRLAYTFGAVSTHAWFSQNGGNLGSALHTQLPQEFMMGSTFARRGAPGFSHLPDATCWTNDEESMIFYLNTYMDGERVYPNVLYACDLEDDDKDYSDVASLPEEDDDTTVGASSQVIQYCVHSEPPVAPDSGGDAAIVEELWAQNVENRIAQGQLASATDLEINQPQAELSWVEDTSDMPASEHLWKWQPAESCDAYDKIFVVRFSRSARDIFPAKLHTGQELETVRAAAAQHCQSCTLKSGASIFVYPSQYDSIVPVLKDYTLRSHHVVVAEAFLPLIYHEVINIPSKSNVKPIDWKLAALADDEDVCVVERSFLNSAPHRHARAEDVTQSTSEIHHCPNARRRTSDGF